MQYVTLSIRQTISSCKINELVNSFQIQMIHLSDVFPFLHTFSSCMLVWNVYILIYPKVYNGRVQLLFVPKRERMWKATTVLLASSCISSNCMRFILHADAYMFHANIIRRRIYTHFLEQYHKKRQNMKILLSKRSVVFCFNKTKAYEMNMKMTNLMFKPWCAKMVDKQYNLWSGVLR